MTACDNWTKTENMLPPQFVEVYVKGINIPEQRSYLKGATFWNAKTFYPIDFPQYWAWPVGYVPPMMPEYDENVENDSRR